MRYQETVWCDGCGVEITWLPQIEAQLHYCCTTCFAGRPCDCGARMEQDAERRARAPAEPMAELVGS
ncbi:MAG: hypothetical protein IT318_06080 [Anaerolineales bacterium]|nr:hypothetical protein [Anaerolineales bacterium]